ncbi:allantoate amidohydrolase [Nocardioides insulae]|uniref:allantoate amidohydrolase n=1 Tax=Nocardioides insulae TaxID=394734 RepID=UPI0004292FFE|nr:allantoate amidohydrolase [Nocardioides insulae]
MDFESMWRELAPVGRVRTGGYRRQPFTSAERETVAWFRQECAARDLTVEEDPYGNLVAWWRPEGAAGDAVLTGSHLDSVVEGGGYDGPLGVVSALAAVDALRERGHVPAVPLGIGVFVEEEGSRFGIACLGSRLATGSMSWESARELRDRDGVAFGDVVAGGARSTLVEGVGSFVELHVEQGRDLVHREVPVGVATMIWPHGRYRFDFRGEANHAGTTRMGDRRDPMLTFAGTALEAARIALETGDRATFGRLEVSPNGTNAVPERVTAWLDARAGSEEALRSVVSQIGSSASEQATGHGTSVDVTAESESPEVRFEEALTAEVSRRSDGGSWPAIATMAGHDAGVLSAAGIPTAMLFVRNPTGISHAPAEYAAPEDCLAGVEALADSLQRLTR